MAGQLNPSDNRLACPYCHRQDSLSTVERLDGYAGLHGATRNPDGSVEYDWEGETDVNWDSSETVGVYCHRCEKQFDEKDLQ